MLSITFTSAAVTGTVAGMATWLVDLQLLPGSKPTDKQTTFHTMKRICSSMLIVMLTF